MYSTFVALVTIAALLWLWRDSLRARELATKISRRACDAEGVQFLDDTVALARVRPVLEHGRPMLHRVYDFEFSRHGNDRERGSVSVIGQRVELVHVALPPQPPDGEPPAPRVIDIRDVRRR